MRGEVALELAQAGASQGAVAEYAAEARGAEPGKLVGRQPRKLGRGMKVGYRAFGNTRVKRTNALANVATGKCVERSRQFAAEFYAQIAFACARIQSAAIDAQTGSGA